VQGSSICASTLKLRSLLFAAALARWQSAHPASQASHVGKSSPSGRPDLSGRVGPETVDDSEHSYVVS
jgi:hypothetical protein